MGLKVNGKYRRGNKIKLSSNMVATVLESPGMSWDFLVVLECPGISFVLEMSLNFSMIALSKIYILLLY